MRSETLTGLLINFYGGIMKNYFCRGMVSTLLLIIIAGDVVGKNVPYHFSSKAVESIPDIVQRSNSPKLNDRISVLEQLIVRNRLSDTRLYQYAYNLAPEDYCIASMSVLEGGLFALKDNEKVRDVFGKITQAAIQFKLTSLLPEAVVFLAYDDPVVQIQSLMILEELEAKEYSKEIAKAASSSNVDVSQPALRILVEFNSKEAVPFLIPYLQDNNSSKQIYAVRALTEIGDRSAIPHLIPLLKTKWNPWILNMLIKLNAQEKVPYIKELYKPGEFNSDYVLTTLAYFGDEQAISDIIAEMTYEKEQRGQAFLERLVKIKAVAVIPALISALENEKAIGGQFNRGGGFVREIMISLAKLEAHEAIPVLRRYLAPQSGSTSLDSFLKGGAIEALSMLKDKEIIPQLLEMLDSRDFSSWADATMALSRLGEPSTIESLIAALRKRKRNIHHIQVLNQLAITLSPNTYEALLIELPSLESLPLEEHLNQLNRKSRVKFSLSENIPLPDETKRRIVSGLSDPLGLHALNRTLDVLNYSGHKYTIFIDNGVVRFVTVEEAYDLWVQWLDEHKKNHPESTVRKSVGN